METKFFVFAAIFSLVACTGENSKKLTRETEKMAVPDFNADSAYHFVKKQVDFGPRIPNSEPHRKAGDYFVTQFKSYGAVVIEQKFSATTYNHQKLNLRNIIASFNLEKKKRILLAAHWDTRPFADKDSEKPNSQFDGANDGASGVAVLLEIARLISID